MDSHPMLQLVGGRADAARMAVSPGADRPIVGFAAILISFALVGLTVILFALANNESVGSDQRTAIVAEGELMDARRRLELASLEIIALRMFDGLSMEGDRTGRLAAAANEVQIASATVQALSAETGVTAESAEALLEDIDPAILNDPLTADLSSMFEFAEDTVRYSGVNDIVTDRRDAIQQLSFVSALPLHTVIEGIGADASVSGQQPTREVAPFVEEMVEVVRTEGGWFGPDPTAPLYGSVWIEIDDANETYPAQTSRLNELVSSSDLVVYDAWMRELGDGNDPPPFSLDEMLVAADALQIEVTTIIDSMFIEEESAVLAALSDRESQRGALLASSIVAGLLALASFVLGVWSISRASHTARERAAMATTDPLTGIGNRYELDERSRPLATDPRFAQHLVAMIDLDKFKMVNDALGHAAGDAVLVAVASRIREIADGLAATHAGSEVSVVRLGGDEFLLTAHSPSTFDEEQVREAFDVVRDSSIDHDTDRIELGFSLGLVVADGANQLADLMSEADLLIYEDKATRARGRAGRQVLPPTIVVRP